MSNNVSVILVGAGYMGKEYGKVLKNLGISFNVVCRSETSAIKYNDELGVMPIYGGIKKAFSELKNVPKSAIVAVNVESLSSAVCFLIENGVKEILVEKPAGLNRSEIEKIFYLSQERDVQVYVAYNRRFYASTEEAIRIINEDGGVSSFSFEFTEWGFKIEKTAHPPVVKEEWLLANSSHVIDLAFFLGGNPTELCAYSSGSLPWHGRASKYSGAGITDKGVTFSYQANWDAPGRWAVEILTSEHRLYLKPMEKLFIQNKGSIAVEEMNIDDKIDVEFKPGLYKQTKAFLSNEKDLRLLSIEEQLSHMDIYEKIEGLVKRGV